MAQKAITRIFNKTTTTKNNDKVGNHSDGKFLIPSA